jgi:hypothetical protein
MMSQFKKLEEDLRTTGAIKWKHAMHLIRQQLQGIEILREADLIVRVSANRAKLLAIKNAELNWHEVDELRVNLHRREFDEAFARTNLRKIPITGGRMSFSLKPEGHPFLRISNVLMLYCYTNFVLITILLR